MQPQCSDQIHVHVRLEPACFDTESSEKLEIFCLISSSLDIEWEQRLLDRAFRIKQISSCFSSLN